MMREELEAESEQLLSVANAFEGIKNNLIDFKNLIYWLEEKTKKRPYITTFKKLNFKATYWLE